MKSGEKWLKVAKSSEKVVKSGEKWLIVMKSGEKLEKVAEMGKSGEKW